MKLLPLFLFLATTLSLHVASASTDEAEKKLQGAVNDVLAVAKTSPDLPTLAAKIRPVLEKHLSFETMTRRAVGPGWRQFTAAQQDTAVPLFTTLIIRSYSKKFVPGEEPTITLKAATEPAPGRVDVPTTLVYQGSRYEVIYRLEEAEDWRITDVVIEGVSLVANYRGQLDAEFKKGGSAEVITSLQQSVDRQK